MLDYKVGVWMKDNEIINKLVSYGKSIRNGAIIFGILVFIGGFIIAENAGKIDESQVLPIIFNYGLYSAGIIFVGFINELVFNWMAAVLKNLKK